MPLPASKLIRRTHMYLALFLTPWMIVYALSGLVLNHAPTVRAWFGGPEATRFEKIGEREYVAAFSPGTDARAMAAQILEDIGLPGSFAVQGGPQTPRLVINRNTAFSLHRITYLKAENRLLVEKQGYNLPMFLNRAHFRHGYQQAYLSTKIWAVTVDLAIVGMVFWVLSGLWMWWELRPTRIWGAACGLAGCGAFVLLFFTL